METREVPPGDAGVRALLEQHNADRVARRGELVDATARPALVAVAADGGIAGVLTYDIAGAECEILTLHAAAQWGGAGTALVEAVHGVAARAGCRTLWVLTTNDNVDGVRLYVEVDDLEATIARAVGHGATVERGRTYLGDDDFWFAGVRDPQGISLGLWTSVAIRS